MEVSRLELTNDGWFMIGSGLLQRQQYHVLIAQETIAVTIHWGVLLNHLQWYKQRFPKLVVPSKSSMFIGFSILNQPFNGVPNWWKPSCRSMFWPIIPNRGLNNARDLPSIGLPRSITKISHHPNIPTNMLLYLYYSSIFNGIFQPVDTNHAMIHATWAIDPWPRWLGPWVPPAGRMAPGSYELAFGDERQTQSTAPGTHWELHGDLKWVIYG